jgi:predicted component of type VI protein secretion system
MNNHVIMVGHKFVRRLVLLDNCTEKVELTKDIKKAKKFTQAIAVQNIPFTIKAYSRHSGEPVRIVVKNYLDCI